MVSKSTSPSPDAAPSFPTPRLGAGPGRPRLTPEHLRARLAEYCARYDVALNDEGLPPFPAGQRETDQHRTWMALYKAHRRLIARGPDAGETARLQTFLAAQHGRCPVCRKPLDVSVARLDNHKPKDAAVLHSRCLELVALARALGPDALDRARSRL